ncbi:ferredoxin [hydrocarbon metagenome]|uniref:Ferredoxin n=1 Tax=hydrocarbon metagenome TaxID=938273 RepID=A0A0W8FFV1_9ZZZZ
MQIARTPIIERTEEIERCIADCVDCAGVCTETVDYCLETGGRHVRPEHVRLMLDCGEICQISASYMLRESTFSTDLCGLCAEVCDRCAKSCAGFTDDPKMKTCADVCRRCAVSCRHMARMPVR